MNDLKKLQDKAKELETKMDAIIKADGKISEWQTLRDELNIIQNIKIPIELNRSKPLPVGGYQVQTYQVPHYV